MRRSLFALVSVCCLASFILAQDGKKDDVFSFQGKWSAIAYTEDGEVATRLEKTPIEWVFEKDQLMIIAHDQQVFKLKGSFKVDNTSDPKGMDMKIDKQDDIPEQNMKGIYRLEKRKLTICYALEGKRPTTFESKQGTGVVLIVLEKK
jgi:uncharacterized protein (TIGR03067 family)